MSGREGRRRSRPASCRSRPLPPRAFLKQQEAVAIGQRLAGLDELDQIALFGVGEFVGCGVGHKR